MEVAIIDYGAGNVFSVATALERLGARVCITREEKTIRRADRVIFPGVGQAEAAMLRLAETGLEEVIPTLGQPVLGICLGMQLMCRHSEEGQVDGLGIFPLEVRRFPAGMKVPHMGWNTLSELRGPLFEGLPEEAWMYFVHSYYVPENDRAAACTCYGLRFAAALEHENFFGCQFHPEKSSVGGRRVLENFLSKNIEKYRREQ